MKTLVGKIVSNKMNKTVVVETERWVTHPMYRKRLRRTKRFHAHDETGAKVGQTVKLIETRPISKTKHFRVIEIVKDYGTA